MEEPIQAQRRIHELPVIGGGGVEGLVVWGGALVTIRKARKIDDMKEMEDNVGGKGMQFVIPVIENPSEKFYDTSKIDSSDLVRTKNLSSEKNAVQTITIADGENKDSKTGHREILLSDAEQESIAISDYYERGHQEILPSDAEGESIALSDAYCEAEESTLPSTDSSSWNESETLSNSDDEETSFSMESSLSPVSTDDEEEYSSIQLSMSSMLSTEENEEDSSIQSSTSSILSTDEDEEDSLIQSSTDDEEEYSSIQSSMSSMLSTDEDEEDSSIQSSTSSILSTDEDEEDSLIQSLMSLIPSTEEENESFAILSTLTIEKGKEEDDDEDGRAIRIGEENSEGTLISSIKSNGESIWPAEMVGPLSTESKDNNLSSSIPVEKKNNEVSKTGEYRYLENANNGGSENMGTVKNKKKN